MNLCKNLTFRFYRQEKILMVNKDLKKPTEEDEGNLSDEVNNQALLLDEIVDSLSETISDLKNIKESDSNYLLSRL